MRGTDLIGRHGEHLVIAAFLELLHWTARKEELDDGFDLNVERPAAGECPSQRFFVQVKTATEMKQKRNGHWSITVRREVGRRYAQARLPVFLFGVDRKTGEIRWRSLSPILNKVPGQRTFSLPPSQVFTADKAADFELAVSNSLAEQDDRYHPPIQALEYRARQLENRDPRFCVAADIIGGKERYTFSAKENVTLNFSGRISNPADALRLRDSYCYGSAVEVCMDHIKVEGSPAAGFEAFGGSLRIEGETRNLRYGIAIGPSKDIESTFIEVDGVARRGVAGFELSSSDVKAPFSFNVKMGDTSTSGNFNFEIHFERWGGRQLKYLPMLNQLETFLRLVQKSGHLSFYLMDYGVRHPIGTATLKPYQSSQIRLNAYHLRILNMLATVAQYLGSDATYRHSDVLSENQEKLLRTAYELLENKIDTLAIESFNGEIAPENRGLVGDKPGGPFVLKWMSPIAFGETFLGEFPITIEVNDYVFREDDSGVFTLEPKGPCKAHVGIELRELR